MIAERVQKRVATLKKGTYEQRLMRAVKAYEKGKDVNAAALGHVSSWKLSEYLSANGLLRHPYNINYTPQELEKAVGLYEAGLTLMETLEKVHVPISALRKQLHKRGTMRNSGYYDEN